MVTVMGNNVAKDCNWKSKNGKMSFSRTHMAVPTQKNIHHFDDAMLKLVNVINGHDMGDDRLRVFPSEDRP